MIVYQAYRFALDPTPRQQGALASHVGGARFAYNWGLGLVQQRLDERAAGQNVEVPWTLPCCRANGTGPRPGWRPGGRRLQGSVRLGPGRAGARGLRNWVDSRQGRRAGAHVGFPRPKRKGRGRAGVPVHDWRDPGGARPSPCDLAPPRAAQDPRVDKEAGPSAGARNRADPGGHDQPAGRPLVCVVHLPGATGRAAPPPASGNRRGGCRGRAAGGAVQRRADRQPPAAHRRSRQAGAGRAGRPANRGPGRPMGHRADRRRAGERPSGSWPAAMPVWPICALRRCTSSPPAWPQTLARWWWSGSTWPGWSATTGSPGRSPTRGWVRSAACSATSALGPAGGWWRPACSLRRPKTCSGCGTVKAKLSLAERTFRCQACGLVVDRDVNAARNLAALVDGIQQIEHGVAGSGPETWQNACVRDRQPTRHSGRSG